MKRGKANRVNMIDFDFVVDCDCGGRLVGSLGNFFRNDFDEYFRIFPKCDIAFIFQKL